MTNFEKEDNLETTVTGVKDEIDELYPEVKKPGFISSFWNTLDPTAKTMALVSTSIGKIKPLLVRA